MSRREYPEPVFDDARDARERAERERAAEIERRRAENRARMPIVASLLDEYAAQFPGSKIVWAIEGGHVVGKPPREELIRAGLLPPDE